MSIQPHDAGEGEQDSTALTCDLDSGPVSRVRHLVRTLLGRRPGLRHGDPVLVDAVLVADELASNAIRHGRGPRGCRLTLTRRGRLLIEVSDTGPGRPRLRRTDETGGRGLVLVDRLATAWGVRGHSGHKTVWAELALDGHGVRRHLSIAPALPQPH